MSEPWKPGEDPLAPRPMSAEAVADLVERARARQDDVRRAAADARWPTRQRPRGRMAGVTWAKLRRPARRWLTDDDVAAIRAARAAGKKLKEIAAEYQISKAHASRVAPGLGRMGRPSGVTGTCSACGASGHAAGGDGLCSPAYLAACLVLDDGWDVAAAADEHEISTQAVYDRLKKERKDHARYSRWSHIPPSGVCSSEAEPECSVGETVTSEGGV